MNKILKKRKLFKGKLINLFLEKQRLPSGRIVNLEVVKHPGAVLIVPLLDKDRVLFIKQYRPVINLYIWELPAGTLRKNENPLRCAKRELAEETGYSAKNWENAGYIYTAPGYTTEKILIFKARGLKKAAYNSEEDEIIFPNEFSVTEIRELLKYGRITDAKTICALKLTGVI